MLQIKYNHTDSMTMRIALHCQQKSEEAGWYFGQTKGSGASGLIDKLQGATVPKQAAAAGATFLEKGKRGNWSLHQGHRRGAGAYQQLLTATCKRNGVCGSPP